jgi:hypothetical protein
MAKRRTKTRRKKAPRANRSRRSLTKCRLGGSDLSSCVFFTTGWLARLPGASPASRLSGTTAAPGCGHRRPRRCLCAIKEITPSSPRRTLSKPEVRRDFSPETSRWHIVSPPGGVRPFLLRFFTTGWLGRLPRLPAPGSRGPQPPPAVDTGAPAGVSAQQKRSRPPLRGARSLSRRSGAIFHRRHRDGTPRSAPLKTLQLPRPPPAHAQVQRLWTTYLSPMRDSDSQTGPRQRSFLHSVTVPGKATLPDPACSPNNK